MRALIDCTACLLKCIVAPRRSGGRPHSSGWAIVYLYWQLQHLILSSPPTVRWLLHDAPPSIDRQRLQCAMRRVAMCFAFCSARPVCSIRSIAPCAPRVSPNSTSNQQTAEPAFGFAESGARSKHISRSKRFCWFTER